MTALARAAIAYARMGIEVFPLKPRQKKPYPFTRGLTDATANPTVTAARWAGQAELPLRPRRPEDRSFPARVLADWEANVACATGPRSGIFVFDVDGAAGEASLSALLSVHGDLPVTPEQTTGGGRQFFFSVEGDAARIRNSASKIGECLDIRGDGGYVVLPPSVHPGTPEKGIPPGRVYSWKPGLSPREIPFAAAPAWLINAALPAEAPQPSAESTRPRDREAGRASRYGEAVLTTACRMIATAPPGKQQENLWGYSCQMGGYVAGGEIEHAYARSALLDAGRQMAAAGRPWTAKDLESHVDRGLAKGELHPRQAPERRAFEPSASRAKKSDAPVTMAQQAGAIRDVRTLWNAARPADCGLVRSWFRARGLDPHALPGALGRLRAAPAGLVPDAGDAEFGPSLLIPLVSGPDDGEEVDALAIVSLPNAHKICGFMGPYEGRVALLTPWPEDGALLVALDLADAWTLGVNAHENGHELGVVLAPTIRSFAGGALADKYGRQDPRTPFADPESPPWTAQPLGDELERAVWIAMRNDLRTPELKSRQTYGGTAKTRLEGDAAARFYGGLAEQAWLRAGPNRVRLMRPSAGQHGFNDQSGVSA